MRPRLDRAQRDAEAGRDLGQRVSFEVLEADDGALVVRELVDCFAHAPRGPGRVEVGVADHLVPMGCRVEVDVELPRLAAPDVDRGPVGDRAQPWPDITGHIERRARSPRLEECLLRRFFGEDPIVQYAVGDREHQAAIRLVQLPDDADVPGDKAGSETVRYGHGLSKYGAV